jgi:hypothetical protein
MKQTCCFTCFFAPYFLIATLAISSNAIAADCNIDRQYEKIKELGFTMSSRFSNNERNRFKFNRYKNLKSQLEHPSSAIIIDEFNTPAEAKSYTLKYSLANSANTFLHGRYYFWSPIKTKRALQKLFKNCDDINFKQLWEGKLKPINETASYRNAPKEKKLLAEFLMTSEQPLENMLTTGFDIEAKQYALERLSFGKPNLDKVTFKIRNLTDNDYKNISIIAAFYDIKKSVIKLERQYALEIKRDSIFEVLFEYVPDSQEASIIAIFTE